MHRPMRDGAAHARRDSNNINNKIHISQLHARTGRCIVPRGGASATVASGQLYGATGETRTSDFASELSEYIEFKLFPASSRGHEH